MYRLPGWSQTELVLGAGWYIPFLPDGLTAEALALDKGFIATAAAIRGEEPSTSDVGQAGTGATGPLLVCCLVCVCLCVFESAAL